MESAIRRKIMGNSFWLLMYQIPNYAFYIILLPLFTRFYNDEIIAYFFLIQGLIKFYIVVTEFGFDFTLTRALIESKKELQRHEYFSSSIYLKIILFISLFPVFYILGTILEYTHNKLLFLAFLFLPFSMVFNFNYVFLAIDKARVMASANMVSKSLVIICSIYSMKNGLDIGYIPLFLAFSNILVGVFLTSRLIGKYGYKFLKPDFVNMRSLLIESKDIALSHAYVAFFGNALSFFSSGVSYNYSFSIYYSYEKIISGFKVIVNTVSQAVFPVLFRHTKISGSERTKPVLIIFAVSSFLYVVSALMAPWFFNFYLGKDFINDYRLLLIILGFVIIQPVSAYLMNIKLISEGAYLLHKKIHALQLFLFVLVMTCLKCITGSISLYTLILTQLTIQTILALIVTSRNPKHNG